MDAFKIDVSFRGAHYVVSLHNEPEPTVKQLGQALAEVTGASYDTLKLVGSKLKGGLIVCQHEDSKVTASGLFSGTKVLLVASTAQEVAAVRAQQEDPTLPSFQHEMRRAALRRRGPSSLQPAAPPSAEFTFSSYQVLEHPGLRPPPAEAMKLLYRLASDPGIMGVMAKHGWKVGLLSEMPPEGKVGVSAMCILGYNVNKGQEISLRLRTDDLKGFRKYQRIRETLVHELTHMVHSDHDVHFKTLNSQLLREVAEFDWKSGGGAHRLLAEAADEEERMGELEGWVDEADVMAASKGDSGKTLRQMAGGSSHHRGDARQAAAEAALQRFQSATLHQPADLPPIHNLDAPELRHEHTDTSTEDAERQLRLMGSLDPSRDPFLHSQTRSLSQPTSLSPSAPAPAPAPASASALADAPAPVSASASSSGRHPGVDSPTSRPSQLDAGISPSNINLKESLDQPGRTMEHPGTSHDPTMHPLLSVDGPGWIQPSPDQDLVSRPALSVDGPGWIQPSPDQDLGSRPALSVDGPGGIHPPPTTGQVAAGPSDCLPAAACSEMEWEVPSHPDASLATDGMDVSTTTAQSQAASDALIKAPRSANSSGHPSTSTNAPNPSKDSDTPSQPADTSVDPASFLSPDDPALVKYRQAEAALKLLVASSAPTEHLTALQTILTVLQNVVTFPQEEKYRRVRISNLAFHNRVGRLPGGLDVLKAVGFVGEQEGGAEILRLRRNDPGLLWLVSSAVQAALEAIARV